MHRSKQQLCPASLAWTLVVILSWAGVLCAQTTSFTYQGRLTDGGNAANGSYDLQFALFDNSSGGTQIGSTLTRSAVTVNGGVFSVSLDFGANAFPGADRFLEIGVRSNGGGSFTVLSPRQQITSTPYATRALSATTAENLTVTASGNFIQNSASQQSASNFNVSGNGTAGGTLTASTVNAVTQYNLGGSAVLSMPGTDNLFVGTGAGASNTTGLGNIFVGHYTGFVNTTGEGNSFFGAATGISNTDGSFNSFFGENTGRSNTLGRDNIFIGPVSGDQNTTGNDNTYVGFLSGITNITGSGNTFIGSAATSSFSNLSNATAIGYLAHVDQDNSLVLGSIAAGATPGVNVGIGTATPKHRLSVIGGPSWTSNGWNGAIEFANASAIGWRGNSSGNRFGIGQTTGGLYFFATGSEPGNTGSPANYVMTLADTANVGIGTTTPAQRLSVNGNALVSGFIQIEGPAVGGDTPLCRTSGTHQLAFCSSSLRYKQRVTPYRAGLELVRRLRPISFTWKESGARDLGLGAEDVAQVEPLLVTHNDKGEIEGVKYDHLNVVLINAVKEQQAQI